MVLDFSFFQIMKSAGNGYFLKFGMGVCCWNLVTLSLHQRSDPVQLQFCNFVLNYASKILSSIAGGLLFGRSSGGKKVEKRRTKRARTRNYSLCTLWSFPFTGLNCSKTLSLTAEHKC